MASMQRASNYRWGDIGEDDDLGFLLPPRQVIGPDENGIKKVIEYRFNDEGRRIKVTTTTRVQLLSQRAAERRSWPKFGDAAREDATGLHLTVRSTEDIHLERLRSPGNQAEEATTSGDSMSQEGGVLMVCRVCRMRGDHWTARCPQRDLLSLMETPPTSEASTSTSEAYVPPSMRSGADRLRRNDENSVRVTNLSEDTCQEDLMELFHPFGAVTRAYVARDKNTSMSRGFGFVNFVSREDAQRAINMLNGYGYDNLILRVEWATPRPS
ncbi:RNA recognition motif domain-containing protein [Hirschfeldia incana]|nr:RNA recognition motif domain-containing protein [Hirschfeldia incana]